jgi:transcription antitermination factor NusG
MWTVARTHSQNEAKACFHLRRAGLRCFWPVIHEYFVDRRTHKEHFKIKAALVSGYVFVELDNNDDRAAALGALGVASLLGWRTDAGYVLAAVRDSYVTTLIEAGPEIVNKKNSKGHFKRGQKVRLALSAVTDIIGEFERLDSKGNAIIRIETLGKVCKTTVEPDRLLAAE